MDRNRLQVYPWFFLITYLAITLGWLYPFLTKGITTSLDRDFIAFWAASKITLHGSAMDAYNFERIYAIEQAAIHHARKLPWIYPPTYLLMVLPLSWLSYGYSLLAFNALTLSGFYLTLRKIAPLPATRILIVLAPGAYVCMLYGQNGLLLTTFAGLSLYLLNRRPIWAGFFLGLLSIKPHVAVLFPLLLLYQRNWLTFFSAGLTVIGLAAVSILAFGLAPWHAFASNLPMLQYYLESGRVPWSQMISVFSLARLAHISVHYAYLIHIAVALVAIAGMLSIWTRTRHPALRAAALIAASLLVSPYMYNYDAVMMALPIAWMGMTGYRYGWLKAEREFLFLAWTAPLIYFVSDFSLVPACSLLLLWFISRKADTLRHSPASDSV